MNHCSMEHIFENRTHFCFHTWLFREPTFIKCFFSAIRFEYYRENKIPLHTFSQPLPSTGFHWYHLATGFHVM